MRRTLVGLSAIALLAAAGSVSAQQSDFLDQGHKPQWLRHPTISPDGEMISFTYRGQIFLVDAEGGLAIPLTGQGAYGYGAVWSPDSARLAFASDINGDDDVYVADFSGTLQRYTWSSASEVPSSFSADGKTVLYNALLLGDAERSVQGALSNKPSSIRSISRAGASAWYCRTWPNRRAGTAISASSSIPMILRPIRLCASIAWCPMPARFIAMTRSLVSTQGCLPLMALIG